MNWADGLAQKCPLTSGADLRNLAPSKLESDCRAKVVIRQLGFFIP